MPVETKEINKCKHEWRPCEWENIPMGGYYNNNDSFEKTNFPESTKVTKVYCIHCLIKKEL